MCQEKETEVASRDLCKCLQPSHSEGGLTAQLSGIYSMVTSNSYHDSKEYGRTDSHFFAGKGTPGFLLRTQVSQVKIPEIQLIHLEGQSLRENDRRESHP